MKIGLRRWEAADGAAFFAASNDPNLYAAMRADFPKTPEACAALVRSFAESPEECECIRAVVIDGAVAGCVAAFFPAEEATLAYWLTASLRGRGVMPAALRMFGGFLFGQYPGLRRLAAEPASGNHASRRALEKAGFRQAGSRFLLDAPGLALEKELAP